MKSFQHLLAVLALALIFSFLFYQSDPGLNMVLFEVVTFMALLLLYRDREWSWLRISTAVAMFLVSIAFLLNASSWTLVINLLAFIGCVGATMAPSVRSFWTVLKLGFLNLPLSGIAFFKGFGNEEVIRLKGAVKALRYYYMLAPAFVIAVFVMLYRGSNPIFDGYFADLTGGLGDLIGSLFSKLNWQWIGVFLLGLMFSVFALVHVVPNQIIERDRTALVTLIRKKKTLMRGISRMALKDEWRAAVLLLFVLNVLLVVVNAIDIYWVWFNFEWQGEYLKQFVHEGTYLLILSIIISMGIVLYFFRGNLNFFSRNRGLKWLCYAWLAQNAILTISVVVRNVHYINHFALASKRIGVMFFLALVLFGLATVFLKVRYSRTNFFLFQMNSLAVFAVLVISALPNWQRIIAEYNFSHYKTSFLHFDYLASFDFEAIPFLDYSSNELIAMEQFQQRKFPFEEQYMTAEQFYDRIEQKKSELINASENQSWKEWTWANQRTHNYLKANKNRE